MMKRGKKQDIPNADLANKEDNENIKTHEIKKIENILLYSGVVGECTLSLLLSKSLDREGQLWRSR